MASKLPVNQSAAVQIFLDKLDPATAEIGRLVRKIILSAHAGIDEHIKWNLPSFFYKGEMEDFDAREYKRDIAVFHVRKGNLMIIMPTGMRLTQHTSILEGAYTDGRRVINFRDINDVITRESELRAVMREWVETAF